MDSVWLRNALKRRDHRIILHFDYDCFYASVFEAENPSLKFLPLAVQQKQIVVTCNYEARRRGLCKLQLIREAKKVCPDVVIVLGEDLGRFRDASKSLYNFLRTFTWNDRVERLGFDEVFMDVTDMVEYNVELLNTNDLENSFFGLSREDPCIGFPFDASSTPSNIFPSASSPPVLRIPDSNDIRSSETTALQLRLLLGAHLAEYLRRQLHEQKGYTATVGISSSRLLSKLVGAIHKPNAQTTLAAPYLSETDDAKSNVMELLDPLEIGKLPGIGFKHALKIRNHVLGRPAKFEPGLIYGAPQDHVSVQEARTFPGMGVETLDTILAGQGSPQDIGMKIWNLLHGIDDREVSKARSVPRQISIEDSYLHMNTLDGVKKELYNLSKSLIKRMRLDLLEEIETSHPSGDDSQTRIRRRKWLAYPRTLRLSTRVRHPVKADGSRERHFNRTSRSGPLPNFIFNVNENLDLLSERLADEALLPLFRRLHSGPVGWDLSLINVAATNMIESELALEGRGRDIQSMFRKQGAESQQREVEENSDLSKMVPADDGMDSPVCKARSAIDGGMGPQDVPIRDSFVTKIGPEESLQPSQANHISISSEDDGREENDEDDVMSYPRSQLCHICGAYMPSFAMTAHERFHNLEG